MNLGVDIKVKIGIITRHAVANYGSFLQSYATQYTLQKLGHEAVIVNYISENEKPLALGKTITRNTQAHANKIKKMLYMLLQTINSAVCYKRFEGFRKKKLRETKEYNTAFELKECVETIDVFCTGSDQVWNTINFDEFDPAYFLNFVPTDVPKISYAASFGRKEFDQGKMSQLERYLGSYNRISVREKSGIDILNRMGLHGSVVLDPTLLLNKEEWRKFSKQPKERNYILVYQLRKNPDFLNYVDKIQKKMKCDVIRVTTDFKQIFKAGRTRCLISPEAFVGYFSNASLVITDSFHGTAFSINFNVPFVEILPDRYAERNLNILKMFGLQSRILEDENIDVIDQPIDYQKVNGMLECARQNSLDWIKNALMEDIHDRSDI